MRLSKPSAAGRLLSRGTDDATETFKFAAIRRLAQSSEFQDQVRSENGIAWGAVQRMLADYLPATISDIGVAEDLDVGAWMVHCGVFPNP